jgi:hypothetical protein
MFPPVPIPAPYDRNERRQSQMRYGGPTVGEGEMGSAIEMNQIRMPETGGGPGTREPVASHSRGSSHSHSPQMEAQDRAGSVTPLGRAL